MAVIPKHHIGFLQDSPAFHVNQAFVVYKNVGNPRVSKQTFQRPQSEHFVQQIGLNFFLLGGAERQISIDDNRLNKAGNRLSRFGRLYG